MIIKDRIPLTYILKEIGVQLVIVILIALTIEVLPLVLDKKYLPNAPISVATTLGIAISILLSFKVSQSYDRWWEARQIWGAKERYLKFVDQNPKLALQVSIDNIASFLGMEPQSLSRIRKQIAF